jgi:hypothetical protein
MSQFSIHHRRALTCAVAAALLHSSMAAYAQKPGTNAPVSPQQGTAAAPDEDAAVRFKRGLKLFDDGDYTLALVEFERAYKLAPNFRALYNIALVNAQLGRYAAATRAFEQYLHDGGSAVSPERQAQVQNSLADLKLRTATLEVAIDVPGAEVLLDGKPLDLSQVRGPRLIDAGEHTLRASAAGYEPAFRTLTLAGGDRGEVSFVLVATKHASAAPPVAPERRKAFVPGLIGTGVLAAGAIASGVVMLEERSHLSSLQNTPGSTEASRASAANQTNTAALVADVFTGLAVATGAVSLYLSLRLSASPRSPEIGISPNRVFLTGSF